MEARASRSCWGVCNQFSSRKLVNWPRRGCLLKPEPPLVVLPHPQIGNVLIPRGHAGSVTLGHMNDAIVSDESRVLVHRQDSQIVGVIIFEFTIPRAFDNFFL